MDMKGPCKLWCAGEMTKDGNGIWQSVKAKVVTAKESMPSLPSEDCNWKEGGWLAGWGWKSKPGMHQM